MRDLASQPGRRRTRVTAEAAAYRRRAWVISRIAPDFRLLDVWPLPVEGDRDEFEAFLDTMASFDPAGSRMSATGVLFWLRRRLGAALGWDVPKERPIPGSSDTTLRARLPDELRESARPLFGGAGGFAPVYRTDDEYAAEISNETVHGAVHLAWVEQTAGRYRAHMAVYVKPRGARGELYMKLIQPFRHLVVYPALGRRIGAAWNARAAETLPSRPSEPT